MIANPNVLLSTGRISTQSITRDLEQFKSLNLLPCNSVIEHEPIRAGFVPNRVFRNNAMCDDYANRNEVIRTKTNEIDTFVRNGSKYFSTGWPNFAWADWYLNKWEGSHFLGLVRNPFEFSASLLSQKFFNGRNDEYQNYATITGQTEGIYYEKLSAEYSRYSAFEKCIYHWLESNRYIWEFCSQNRFKVFRFEEIRGKNTSSLQNFYQEFTGHAVPIERACYFDKHNFSLNSEIQFSSDRLLGEVRDLCFELGYSKENFSRWTEHLPEIEKRYSNVRDKGTDSAGRLQSIGERIIENTPLPGTPKSMRVAVVTPYFREDNNILRLCLESVRDQTHPECRHFIVADGYPNPLVDDYQTTHIRLPSAHGDNGNFARCIGAMAAWSEGFDAIAFLDADNWYRSDHIARLVALQARTGVALCTSGRSLHRLDGSLLSANDSESDGVSFADTSCLCFFQPAFDLVALWGAMPSSTGPICDKIMWDAVKLRGISRAHDPEPTVAFRSQYAFHYAGAGEEPPKGAKSSSIQREAWVKFKALSYTQRIGLVLGLNGAQDLQFFQNAQPARPTQLTDVSVRGVQQTLRLEIPTDDGINFVAREIFEQQQYRPVPRLSPPRAILDIGANVGLAAAYFRLIYPGSALVCVEPDPRAYALLARNAATIGNCVTVCAGLTLGMQTQPFYLGRSSVLNSVAAVSEQARRLLMIDAERLVQDLQRKDFDLIKIDTEGAEIPILLSLRHRLAKTAQILLEFHSDSDRRVIDALLSETHFLFHSTVTSPHRGNLCYVQRAQARNVLPDTALT